MAIFAYGGMTGRRMARPMTKLEIQENLAAEQRVALAHMRGTAREMLAGAFALDRRLARIVAHEGEPLLAQMRRSEEHTSELQSLMRISYAVACLKKKIS